MFETLFINYSLYVLFRVSVLNIHVLFWSPPPSPHPPPLVYWAPKSNERYNTVRFKYFENIMSETCTRFAQITQGSHDMLTIMFQI